MSAIGLWVPHGTWGAGDGEWIASGDTAQEQESNGAAEYVAATQPVGGAARRVIQRRPRPIYDATGSTEQEQACEGVAVPVRAPQDAQDAQHVIVQAAAAVIARRRQINHKRAAQIARAVFDQI